MAAPAVAHVGAGLGGALDQAAPPDLRRLTELAEDAFAAATAAAGVIERDYDVAGHRVRLRLAGSALDGKLTPALAHLVAGEDGRRPALTVSAWDGRSTGTGAPPVPCRPTGAAVAARRDADGARRLRGAYQDVEAALSLLDDAGGKAWYWAADAGLVHYYDTSAPFRILLHWWMSRRGRQLVHAAAVGDADGGALVVGRSGSGKSTTALACLLAGLAYAGDDYVLVGTDPEPTVYSLYCSGKLEPDHVARFPELAPSITNADRLATEKAVVFASDRFADRLRPSLPLRAVVLPEVVGDRPGTTVARAPRAAALAALAPSTILQLPGAGEAALRTAGDVVRAVPAFSLRIGSDVAGIGPAVRDLLSEVSAG